MDNKEINFCIVSILYKSVRKHEKTKNESKTNNLIRLLRIHVMGF